MNQRIHNLFIFCWGGMLYGLVEIFWRGNTHWTMVVTGGICFLLLDRLDRMTTGKPAAVRCMKGAILITAVELVAGLFINQVMGLDVWDYSHIPFNFAGQICPLYTIYWYFLCYPAFWLLRGLRCKSYKNPG